MTKKLTLREARKVHGMTQNDLARESGISTYSIRRIEGGVSTVGINERTAEMLAAAVACEVNEIDWPRSLSLRGRPPGTGMTLIVKTTTKVTVTFGEDTCSRCFTQYPVANRANKQCPNCDM